VKKISLLFISIIFILNSCTTQEVDIDINKIPETEMDSVSYSFGLGFAFTLKNQGMDTIIDLDYFCKAFHDVFRHDSLNISKEDGEKILDQYFTRMQKQVMDKQLSDNKKLIKESNGASITLASGLIIKIVEDKDGPTPELSDTVTTEITITGKEGNILQEFPEPQSFVLSQVFPGLSEGIQLMSIGDKWNLTIPPDLAAGGGDTVIFQVELLEIN
tara:strand:+ start:1251 stop:1898 length:648 start_codon:yes stop_codon:yes gene_type:complete